MKKLIINKIMNKISIGTNYDYIKLQEIRYGLEAIYVNVSKFTVFFIINAILGNFISGLIFFGLFIPIKSTSYGFHAKTSLQCWIISGLAFVGMPLISEYLYFNLYSKIILIICFWIFFGLLSPADTPKRPLVNKNTRMKLKISTLIILAIYSILIITTLLSNILILILLYQTFLINPLTYLAFNTQYNNYLYYKQETN